MVTTATPPKKEAGYAGPGPKLCVERSRSQVMCRTGLSGPGSALAMKYGKGKKYLTLQAAVDAAKEWKLNLKGS